MAGVRIVKQAAWCWVIALMVFACEDDTSSGGDVAEQDQDAGDQDADGNLDIVEVREEPPLPVCEAGSTECATELAVTVCAHDGSTSVTLPCDPGSTCEDGVCEFPPGSTCTPGESACASATVLSVCQPDAESEVMVPCRLGDTCDQGACVASEGESCVAGATTCPSVSTLEVCQADQTTRVVVPCAEGQVCDEGQCVLPEGDSCTPGSASCPTGTTLEVCQADGTTLVVVPCASGQVCEEGSCVEESVGTTLCVPNAIDCADDEALEICLSDGLTTVRVPCGPGQFCDDGECQLEPRADCEPGESTCLSSFDVGTCQDDGFTYTLEACDTGERCVNGDCRSTDVPGTCSIGGIWCEGSDTVLRCNGEGTNFTTESCPGGTACEPGRGCLGSACAIGEVQCIDDRVLARCADGDGWTAEYCDLGCASWIHHVTGRRAAVCVEEGECVAGARFCGDPRAEGVNPLSGYNECQLVDNELKWVWYECGDGLECGPRPQFLPISLSDLEHIGLQHTEGAVPACVPADTCNEDELVSSDYRRRCGADGGIEVCIGDTWVDDVSCDPDETCVNGTSLDIIQGLSLFGDYDIMCHADVCVDLVQNHAPRIYEIYAGDPGSPIYVGVCDEVEADRMDRCLLFRAMGTNASCPGDQECVTFDSGSPDPAFGACQDVSP